MVILKTSWAYGDAESSITLTSEQWAAVKRGERLEMEARAVYEGVEDTVVWIIDSRVVSIIGEEEAVRVWEQPIEELIAKQ
jgi:hypothetical protein